MFEEIRNAIQEASADNQKVAMFLFQVLKNADKLADVDPEVFCHEMGMTEAYPTEFRKMLALSRLMKQQGVRLMRDV
jgi:hypothetical protein